MRASEFLRKVPGFAVLSTITLITAGVIISATARAEDKPAGPSLKDALDVYADVTGRTILRPATIPAAALLSAPIPSETKTAAAFIETEAAKLGIEIVPDGEAFARVLPEGWRDNAPGKYLGKLSPPPHQTLSEDAAAKGEIIPIGAIMFRGADVNQILLVYTDLRKCTLIRPPFLASPPFFLTTKKALTKAEVIYAMDVILAMNGIATIKDGDKFVRVVNLPEASQMRPHAPTRQSGETLIEAKDVPVFRWVGSFKRPPSATDTETAQPKEKQRPEPTVDNLVAYYAKLTDCTATPAEKTQGAPPNYTARA